MSPLDANGISEIEIDTMELHRCLFNLLSFNGNWTREPKATVEALQELHGYYVGLKLRETNRDYFATGSPVCIDGRTESSLHRWLVAAAGRLLQRCCGLVGGDFFILSSREAGEYLSRIAEFGDGVELDSAISGSLSQRDLLDMEGLLAFEYEHACRIWPTPPDALGPWAKLAKAFRDQARRDDDSFIAIRFPEGDRIDRKVTSNGWLVTYPHDNEDNETRVKLIGLSRAAAKLLGRTVIEDTPDEWAGVWFDYVVCRAESGWTTRHEVYSVGGRGSTFDSTNGTETGMISRPFYWSAVACDELQFDAPVSGRNELDSRPQESVPDYVTLKQAAPLVGRSKGTLENWKRDDPEFPPPDVIGGDGRANEWRWSNLRPYLQTRTKRELPEVHPATQGVGF